MFTNAQQRLGSPQDIQRVFIDFQQRLYAA